MLSKFLKDLLLAINGYQFLRYIPLNIKIMAKNIGVRKSAGFTIFLRKPVPWAITSKLVHRSLPNKRIMKALVTGSICKDKSGTLLHFLINIFFNF